MTAGYTRPVSVYIIMWLSVVYMCLDDILHINDLMNLAKRTRNIYDRMEKNHFIVEANNCLYGIVAVGAFCSSI